MARPRFIKDVVFAKRVDHPGTRAQPYLIPAGRQAMEYLKGTLLPKAMRAARGTASLKVELEKAARAAAFKGLQVAQRLTPVDTARLKSSLTVAKRDDLVFTVGTNVWYARWVEEGTDPHPILPRKRQLLRFIVKRPRVS